MTNVARTRSYPLTAMAFGAQPFNVFAGGVDNVIRVAFASGALRLARSTLTSIERRRCTTRARKAKSRSRCAVVELSSSSSSSSSPVRATFAPQLRGHDDTISGLALSPDGGYLLSNCLF